MPSISRLSRQSLSSVVYVLTLCLRLSSQLSKLNSFGDRFEAIAACQTGMQEEAMFSSSGLSFCQKWLDEEDKKALSSVSPISEKDGRILANMLKSPQSQEIQDMYDHCLTLRIKLTRLGYGPLSKVMSQTPPWPWHFWQIFQIAVILKPYRVFPNMDSRTLSQT